MALKISIGCDPEVWLQDIKTGKFVSAHDKIPGTKEKPHPVEGGAVQVDGVAAEFNTHPAYTADEFVSYIQTVGKQLQNFIGKDFRMMSQPVAEFGHEYLKSLPDHVRMLGCNPDWNAWTGQVNKKPDENVTFRTGAGHIHLGWGLGMNPGDSGHIEDCRIVARQMDYFLGMHSLMWDPDTQRRKLYGCAGAFRPKPYGVEYRPLSNRWLASKNLQRWVFNAAHRGLHVLITEGVRIEEEYKDACVDIINNSVRWWEDKKLSRITEACGLLNPPKITSEPEKELTKDELIRLMVMHLGFNTSLAKDYLIAASKGNAQAQSKIDYVKSLV